MVRMLTCVLAACLGVMLGSISMLAAPQASAGDIKGVVVDSTGARVSGATVTVAAIDTGIERQVLSDDLGAYHFFSLAPGAYSVQARKTGFTTYTRRPLQLTVGQILDIELTLEPIGASTEVLVQAPTPVLEPEKTQQGSMITSEQIENLPINQRTFLEYTLLTPAVTEAPSLVPFALPQAPSSGLSFLGQSPRYNCITIDGVDAIDDSVGAVRATISQEAAQEFQVNRSNFSAEFGRCSGGFINIVSKSGTSRWGGVAFAFFRNQALDARNAFAFGPGGSEIDPPFSRQQAGFTVGGPLIGDRTFAFLSYEGLRRRESRFVSFLENTSFFAPTSAPADHQQDVIAALAASGSPSFQALAGSLAGALTTSETTFPETIDLLESNSGVFPFRDSENILSLRIDHTLFPDNQLFARLNFSDTDISGGAFGGLQGPSHGANYQVQDYGGALSDTYMLDSTRANEFRFQFARRKFDVFPADPSGPEVSINGVAVLGRDYYLPSTRTETRFQWLDNYTVVRGSGKHQLKFGGDLNYLRFDTSTEVFLGGRFIFGEAVPLARVVDSIGGAGTSASIVGSGVAPAAYLDEPIRSIQAFNLGLPIVYQQGFGDPRARFSNTLLSGYALDLFNPTEKLNVNLGLRYDLEIQPRPIHRDTNNLAPRLGFTYALTPRTLLRGGYGIYYAQVFEAVAFIARVLDGQQIAQVFTPLDGLPSLGITTTASDVWSLAAQGGVGSLRTLTAADLTTLGLVPGATPPVLLSAAAGIVNPYSQQFSFGFDHDLRGMNLSVNYLGNHGVKLLRSRNVNEIQVGANAYGPVLGPINPAILQDNQVESSGSSIYHGLTVSLLKRYSDFSQFQISYTLSKTIDDTTDFIVDLQPANPLDLRNERGLSAFDQRNRLVISGVFESPFERGMGAFSLLRAFRFAPIFTWASGRPFNVLLGFDANNDTNANTDRPAGFGRNVGKGPDYVSLNMRIARDFEVSRGSETRLEAIFEVFNVFNRVNYSGVNTVVGVSDLAGQRIVGRPDRGPADPLGFTSAFDPRQIQLGLKLFY
ncbi:MAG TPA: TonB-dependent receptor [Terriglobia bacterium]|nr:TonB-dependent receptor [Terriglobia bacterium]